MKVEIKNVGWREFTCGWLAKGLQSGDLRIEQGVTKRGMRPGLWLQWTRGDKQHIECLAVFNPFEFDSPENIHLARFQSCGERDTPWGGEPDHPWTEAAWRMLDEIGRSWCDAMTAERENDVPVKLTVTCVPA